MVILASDLGNLGSWTYVIFASAMVLDDLDSGIIFGVRQAVVERYRDAT